MTSPVLSDDKFEPSFQEVESWLESVLNNQILKEIPCPDGPRFIIFRHPTSQEILFSRFIREQTLHDAKKEGLPSIEEVDSYIQERGFLKDDSTKIEDLQTQLDAQKTVLEKTQIPGRKESLKEVIKKLENDILSLRSKREAYYYLTRERKADEVSYLYLAWASTYSMEGKKYWETFDEFEEEKDLNFRNELLEAFSYFNRGLSTKIVRYLARHNLWRIRFVAAQKTGGGNCLFNRPFNDLTPDQLGLLYWSNYYQSIYDMMPDDQPPHEIIEDDKALDSYMEQLIKEKDAERKESKAEGRSSARSSKLSAWKTGDELIITPSNPDYMSLAYSDKRVQAVEGVSEVEVIAPNSRRARNRRARARGQSQMKGIKK